MVSHNNSESSSSGPEISKAEIRARGLQLRRNLADKDRRSVAVCERFRTLTQYADAATVLVTMHIRAEVRTTDLVTSTLHTGKRLVVPYCQGDDLKLFLLADLTELSVGTFGILEPQEPLRSAPAKQVAPGELDLLAVPGVAFDRSGGRVGHGRGYFDRLLRCLRPDACSIGLAFECQLFDRVPMEEHDVALDGIVTEKGVYFTG
jgi:5-formyltetrahydrofolate cyclo-ligase